MVHTTQAHLDENSPLLRLSLGLDVGGDLIELLVDGAQSATVGQHDLKPLDRKARRLSLAISQYTGKTCSSATIHLLRFICYDSSATIYLLQFISETFYDGTMSLTDGLDMHF